MRFLMITSQCATLWPVAQWYVERMSDGSDEPWGVFALLTAFIVVIREERRTRISKPALLLSTLWMVVYAFSLNRIPPLASAACAMLALGCSLSGFWMGRISLSLFGLLLLSLPLIASLQFYIGYPLRALTAQLVAQILGLCGIVVQAKGTSLEWLREIISVDAPCSGIRMLWTGLYLTFSLASFSRLGNRTTWLSYLASSVIIFSGNVTRATILFLTESGMLRLPWDLHDGIGLFVFGIVAVVILHTHRSLLRRERERMSTLGGAVAKRGS